MPNDIELEEYFNDEDIVHYLLQTKNLKHNILHTDLYFNFELFGIIHN